MLTSYHYICKCAECGVVISQCRCPSPEKFEQVGICQKCKELQQVVDESTYQ